MYTVLSNTIDNFNDFVNFGMNIFV